MPGRPDGAAYLNADFDVGDVVLVEHDVVPLLVEPLGGAAPEKAPHLIQHRSPRVRELRPRCRHRYHRGRRRFDRLHGHIDSHGAEHTPLAGYLGARIWWLASFERGQPELELVNPVP